MRKVAASSSKTKWAILAVITMAVVLNAFWVYWLVVTGDKLLEVVEAAAQAKHAVAAKPTPLPGEVIAETCAVQVIEGNDYLVCALYRPETAQ